MKSTSGCCKWIGLVVILLLSSCSANWHLKQAIRKNPDIATKTIVNRDTVILTQERLLKDTIEVYKDTILWQDRVRVEVQWRDKEIIVSAKCPQDTIVVTKTISTTELVKPKSLMNQLEYALGLVLVLVSLVILVYNLVRHTKY